MTYDTWTTAAVADELRQTLVPGRVQQVVQVDETGYAFEIYAGRERRYLLASASQQAPRVHLSSDKQRRGVDSPSPLVQLLRKFVRGSALVAVTQPPWERILHLEFHHPEFGASVLVAEMIGRWANLLLLRPTPSPRLAVPLRGGGSQNGYRILECVHRHRPQEGAGRLAMPGQLYMPPPPQEGWPPEQVTELALRTLLEAAMPDAAVWRVLVDGLQGISPQAAREIVFLALGDAQTRVEQVKKVTPLLETLGSFVRMLAAGAWQPCIVRDASGKPLAFAPFALSHRTDGEVERVDSISAAIERYYHAKAETAGDSYAAARRQAGEMIERAIKNQTRRKEAIDRELHPPEEIERLRTSGEWILALASQIAPRQVELTLPDGVDLPPIRLDPALSPAENAAAYFKRYRKARRAASMGGPRLAELHAELAYLEQLATDLALAADRNEIDAVRAALAEAGYARQRRPARSETGQNRGRQPGRPGQPQVQGPRQYTSREGYAILVGRNSRQNEHVTFDLAGPNDLWLHARDWPGSHVVIRSGGQPVSEETVRQAAALAAYYSKGQREAAVDVTVAERRRVRQPPGQHHPGMVLVDGERVVRVQPALPAA